MKFEHLRRVVTIAIDDTIKEARREERERAVMLFANWMAYEGESTPEDLRDAIRADDAKPSNPEAARRNAAEGI